ncbi:hypothetical protein MPSEU_000452400 [Mayamaea pseudoterrestris]|nr:hypothetical protein MPSEU_000452400 [Mayamaea pseudoterrestris]
MAQRSLLLGLLLSSLPTSTAYLPSGKQERRSIRLADQAEPPMAPTLEQASQRLFLTVLDNSPGTSGTGLSSTLNENDAPLRNGKLKLMPQPPPRPRLKNPAFGDVAVLRKQTASLLEHSATSNETDPASQGKRKLKRTFHYLMDAWAFSQQKDSVEQASKLLDAMESLPNILLDVRSYTKFINVIARSPTESAGKQADDVLAKMKTLGVRDQEIRPNTYSYTAVLEAHAHTGTKESAQRAQDLCDEIVLYYKEGQADIHPTSRAWNAAIIACGKAGQAYKAQAIFDQLQDLSDQFSKTPGKTPVEAPNAWNYNALISAWANAGDAGSALRAEQVLDRMEAAYANGNVQAKPTVVSYNAVIDAFAKSGDEGAASKAEAVLRHMEDLYEAGAQHLRPNARSFNSVINAWAKSREDEAATKAQDILDLMEKLHVQGNEEVRPDVHSFCSVINAWARSQQPRKAERAYNLLREMTRLYEAGNKHVRPNVIAYNAVMNACAFTSDDVIEQGRALEIAHNTLKEMEETLYAKPDQVTYGTFLRLCSHLPDCSTRQKVTEVLFRKCVKDGQVGSLVLSQIRTMVSDDVYERLVGRRMDEDVQMADLPKAWWCNVVEGKWRRKRSIQ